MIVLRDLRAGLVAACLALSVDAAWAQKAEDAFGTWLNPANGTHIQMYKCGAGLCAKIAKITDGQKTDDKNPDAAKRSQPIIGLVIMNEAKPTGGNTWQGSLYNREDGKSYSGTITVKNKDTLDLSGCVAVVLCKTVTWTRVK